MAYQVKAAAEMSGVSVRTLRYYDEIGLLKPSSATPAGYRLYTDSDMERLQQVLFFREMGLSLRDIKVFLDSPEFDRKKALAMHREHLVERQRRLGKLLRSVDRTLEAMEKGVDMASEWMFTGFDEGEARRYQEEARQRWGNDTVDESLRRTAGYTEKDWQALHAEIDQITRGVADGMGGSPSEPVVQEWIGKWFATINRFFDCSPEMFRGLDAMYVEDPRFAEFYERRKPGLAVFMRDAMSVFAESHGS
ncbi:MAG: MerR family transcriptional regulator [Chloroflexota bacterium]